MKIELGRAATAGGMLAIKPDSVVLATGAHQRRPNDFIGDGVSARDWEAQLEQRPRGATAVLFDMDHSAATYAVADALARDYRRLVLLTPRQQIARNVNYCSAIGIHRRLYEANAEIVLSAEPVSFRGGRADLAQRLHRAHPGTRRRRGVRLVDAARCRRCRRKQLHDMGIDTRLIGDCMAPRNLLCAIHEGEAAALAL